MTTGRRAARSNSTACVSASPSAAGPHDGSGSAAGGGPSGPSPNAWSSGKSRNAAPPCGAIAAASASSISAEISPVLADVAASFVSGATNGT